MYIHSTTHRPTDVVAPSLWKDPPLIPSIQFWTGDPSSYLRNYVGLLAEISELKNDS